MMNLCCELLEALGDKTIATAESCTGGGIGAAITAVPGASQWFRGGIISYCNDVKHHVLGVDEAKLNTFGAVSAPVAEEMARGARRVLGSDIALAVTGLAGPGGDEYGNPVGTVFIGYCDESAAFSRKFLFSGSREEIRGRAIREALNLALEMVRK